MTFRLRYIPDTNDGVRFATIRYPSTWQPGYPTRERAAQVLAAMPNPGRMEIIEEEDA